jgi:hypothetical protein
MFSGTIGHEINIGTRNQKQAQQQIQDKAKQPTKVKHDSRAKARPK